MKCRSILLPSPPVNVELINSIGFEAFVPEPIASLLY